MTIKILVVTLVVGLLVVGCSSPEKAFEKASQVNTIEAYSEFLQKYTTGDYAKKAKSRLADIVMKQIATEIPIPNPLKDMGQNVIEAIEAQKELNILSGSLQYVEDGILFAGDIRFDLSRFLPNSIEIAKTGVQKWSAFIDFNVDPVNVPVIISISPGPNGKPIAALKPDSQLMFDKSAGWLFSLRLVEGQGGVKQEVATTSFRCVGVRVNREKVTLLTEKSDSNARDVLSDSGKASF